MKVRRGTKKEEQLGSDEKRQEESRASKVEQRERGREGEESGGRTEQMCTATREEQRDALLCPVGCKRNLLSGYAVPAVLIVSESVVASLIP